MSLKMGAKYKKEVGLTAAAVLVAAVIAALIAYFRGHNVAVLQPAGTISHQERNLIFVALLLCCIVVIPVFTLTTAIALKYREGNKKKTKYSPDWDGNRLIESIWWGIPFAIIFVLAIITWNSSYNLDPYKALASSKKPLNIQVISLDWKWLFIYPEQNIATVNYARFPVNTPIDFQITSDSVMNSFWVPNLAGQIYSMPGMSTELHVMASKAGSYYGSSANISGKGFAGMNFTAAATSPADFNQWLKSVKASTNKLNMAAYQKLTQPSSNNPVAYYSSAQKGLYDYVVMKYMAPVSAPDADGEMVMDPNMGGMAM